jgi:putative spermidine/putrescine transport system ATP-binding protein
MSEVQSSMATVLGEASPLNRVSNRRGGAVELRGLTKRFGAIAALESFSLAAQPGELVVMLGPSGCGKTTALRALAGLESIDQGSVIIDGKDVTRVATEHRSIGMVFQNYSLFPNMTARANVEFGLRVRGMRARERAIKSSELLELVGLGHAADRFPHQLSGGQQQRIAIARALAIEPEVLLLDEPLSALDAKVRGQLREEIRRIQRELGITTFFVTHDQEEALALADRIAVLQSGHLEQFGAPWEVYGHPSTDFVARFVGQVNVLNGVVVGPDRVSVEGIGEVRTGDRLAGFPTHSTVSVYVRPETFHVEVAADGRFEVDSVSFLGGSVRLGVRDGERMISVSYVPDADRVIALGDRVHLRSRADAVYVTSASQ